MSELIVKSRRTGDPTTTTLAATTVVALAGMTVIALVPDDHEVPMTLATAQSAARIITAGAYAGALVVGSEKVMEHTIGERGLPTNLAVAVGLGAGIAGLQVLLRNRRATHHGEGKWHERRPTVADRAPVKIAKAVGMGAAVAGGLVALAGAQFAIAEGTPNWSPGHWGGPLTRSPRWSATWLPRPFWARRAASRWVACAVTSCTSTWSSPRIPIPPPAAT